MAEEEEEILPFAKPPSQIAPATQCRGTLIASSRRALETQGLFARYEANLLTPEANDLRAVIPGQWVPIALAAVHYGACERLCLSEADQMHLGALVSDRIQKTFLATVLKLAREGGVTPWTGIRQFGKIYERLFTGGGVSITKVGPKDARVHIIGLPLAVIPYFRNGYRGVIVAGCEFFTRRAYCRVLSSLTSENSLAYRVSWV